MKEEEKLIDTIVKYRIVIFSLFVTLGCVFLLFYLEENRANIEVYKYDSVKALIFTILGISIIKLFWDLSAKKEFARYVVSICNLSYNIKESGVISIESSFNKIDWENFYKDATEIELALFHAQQTLQWCSEYIRDASCSKRPPKISIKFPDHTDIDLMNKISDLEQYDDPKELQSEILSAILALQNLSDSLPNSNIKILTSKKLFPFSIYKSNQRSIIMLPKNSEDKKTVLIECENEGLFFSYIEKHFKKICNEAIEVSRS